MSQWILKSNGKIVPRRSVRPLNKEELHSKAEQDKRDLFDKLVKEKLGDSVNPMPKGNEFELNHDAADEWVDYEDGEQEPWHIPSVDDPVDNAGRALNQQPMYDYLIHAELMMSHEGKSQPAKVIGRSKQSDGEYCNSNPILNGLLYDVEFPDGQVKEYAANVIAENLLSQVDDTALYYLRSRGIDAKTAQQLLVQAFLAEAIEQIGDEAIIDMREFSLNGPGMKPVRQAAHRLLRRDN